VFHESTFDDFISDAGHVAQWLARDERIDAKRIGVYGGSEGGRLAPLVAARFPIISLAISASGPVGRVEDHANFNMNYALRVRGHPDSVVDQVMPLWHRHHAAWANQDRAEMKLLAEEVVRLREVYDPLVIPSTEEEILTDPGLYFLRPMFNSLSRDYISELVQLRVPWLAMYGEVDPIVNVQESIANIQQCMNTARHKAVEIVLIENVGHSYVNSDTRERVPNEHIVLNWLTEKMGDGS
jgi:dienelactone hydrolase